MSVFAGYEHLLQAEYPNYPADVNNYFVIHGSTGEIFNKTEIMDVELYYDEKDAKKIIPVEYYMKDSRCVHYHGSLYIKKSINGNHVYRTLLLMFLKRMEQKRESEDIALNAGVEIKKTYLFPTDFLFVWRSRLTAEKIKNIGFTSTVYLSPIIVSRRIMSGGTKVEIQSNIVYEFDPEFPLLLKPPTEN